jgi:predicted lipid-binding transport protein (Tim44 family)
MNFRGGFPVDIVLLVLVAGFLILRLRSVLGKRTGYERPPLPDQPNNAQNPPQQNPQATPLLGRASMFNNIVSPLRTPASPPRALPSPHTVTGQTLAQIQAADRNFDPTRFIGTAEAAFRTIVTAFAQSDLKTLSTLLNPSVFGTFEQAIALRAESGEVQHTEIKSILQATIEEAEIISGHAMIVVRFESDQVSFTRDRGGDIIAGTEAVTEIVDLWTFERSLNANNQTWLLAAARSG